MIGAEPRSDWLPAELARDEQGFILTGSDLVGTRNPAALSLPPRPPRPLETSIPGVFAAGDIRSGSVKRVASAVGEGSVASTQMYQYLEERSHERPG
jgi:thioredoxin reductase (NADPH)